jgi:hypothetical protein
VNMRRFVPIFVALSALLAFGIALDGCNQQTVTATLRSLQSSTEVTFVCRGTSDEGNDRGLELSECPDPVEPPSRTMYAVITQISTNELAIVDLAHQKVIDVDPAIPGYTFLRLPSRPGAITTTPGGEASFVGLITPGKTGISAIPTTCLGPPSVGEHARDLTTFPACTLSSAPGDIAVVVEPPAADGTIYATCDQKCSDPKNTDPTTCEDKNPPSDSNRDCVSNLTTERGPVGRRKLVVALPDKGELAVIDAQSLLDRQPGSFDPCVVEEYITLNASPDTSGQSQVTPDDLQADASCTLNRPTPAPVPANAPSRPLGIAATDARLYVSDASVPAVHVLDSTSVCHLSELPPLLPMSYVTPSRVVTTSRIAVSPLTPAGRQYVYAVDADDQPASVMAFDVSPGATDRTPIVRNGSARQPGEQPDRISFAAPVQDIDFAFRDLPREDLDTGVAEVGVQCDPNPDASIDPPTPGVQYRTSADYTQGARPRLLRGLFGLVMLTSGQVVVIDVDDFDAPCRRNYQTNADPTNEDFRGCKGDTIPYPYLTYSSTLETGDPNGTKTVSNEVSCNMVEPHRARAAVFGLSLPTLGLGAPSLRSLPQFTVPLSVTNLTPRDQPKLLAVAFNDPSGPVPPQAYVGTTLYSQGNTSAPLRTNPNDGDDSHSAVTLPLIEPRSYPTDEHNNLAYEGPIMPDKLSGFLEDTGDTNLLNDNTAFFCDNGVYDIDAMADYAHSVLGMTTDAAATFATTHADYVQVTGDFPTIIDSYWQSAPHDRAWCLNKFGQPPRSGATELQPSRDLSILSAYQDHLVVTPRVPLDYDPVACSPDAPPLTPGAVKPYCPPVADDFEVCFPTGMRYTVRGSRQWVLANTRPDVTHDIIADPANQYRCIRDCDPRRQHFRGRVFEIGRTATCGPTGDCSASSVGAATDLDGPCSYDPIADDGSTQGVSLDEPASACIFENLTSRFAIYRGLQPSVRDMTYSWDTAGGFYALTASLASVSTAVLPQTVRYIPEYQAIAVVDGASLGFSLMALDTLQIISPWPVY